jgi:hypothetical protein
MRIESLRVERVLANKPVYRYQALANGIDGEEKTFQSDGAQQGWTVRRYKTWRRNFIAIESQTCFGYGPDVPLSAGNHHPFRPRGFQLKLFRQGLRQHAKRSASVHKKFNFFNTARRTGQMAPYVEQSHIQCPLNDELIVAQLTNNATIQASLKKVAKHAKLPVDQATQFGFIANFTIAKQIGLTIPPNVLARADRVIR